MSAFLIALGAGCVLQTSSTELKPESVGWTEHIRVHVLASTGACDHVEIVLPAGSSLTSIDGRVLLSDDTKRKLDHVRYAPTPRDLSGERRVRVLLPDMLKLDRVRLDIERRWVVEDTYTWEPGRDNALWASLDLPKRGGASVHGEVEATPREAWVAKASPADRVHVWKQTGGIRPVFIDDSGEASPSEALADISTWVLLPERPDLWGWHLPKAVQRSAGTPRNIAAALVGRTERGPSPLQLAYAYPSTTTPDTKQDPPSAVVAVRVDGEAARVWAHPDQQWNDSWRLWLPDGTGPLQPLGVPAGEPPDSTATVLVERDLELLLPTGRSPQASLVPGAGSSARTVERVHLDDETRTRTWTRPLPPGATDAQVAVRDGTHSQGWLSSTADQIVLLAAKGERPVFEIAYTSPDAPTCGERHHPEGGLLTSLTVHGSGAQIITQDTFWWLASWQDVPIMDERARVVAGLFARFNGRTLPEPGLPIRYKGHNKGWDLAAQLRVALEERVSVLDPRPEHIFPRGIHKARKSGVVTPIEAALIVRAYANQGHMEADWALVRPANEGDGHTICPAGHEQALVRLGIDGERRWIDPGCDVCGPFEVRPELEGGTAMGPWLDRAPAPSKGLHHVHVDGKDVTWVLEGPAALQLRRWLQPIPDGERGARIASRVGGAEATLTSAQGVGDPGAPITLKVKAADVDRIPGPRAWLAPAPLPAGEVWIDWVGERRFTRPTDIVVPDINDGGETLRATASSKDGVETRSLFVHKRRMSAQRLAYGTPSWWISERIPAQSTTEDPVEDEEIEAPPNP